MSILLQSSAGGQCPVLANTTAPFSSSFFQPNTSGDESEHKQVLNNAPETLADRVSTSGDTLDRVLRQVRCH